MLQPQDCFLDFRGVQGVGINFRIGLYVKHGAKGFAGFGWHALKDPWKESFVDGGGLPLQLSTAGLELLDLFHGSLWPIGVTGCIEIPFLAVLIIEQSRQNPAVRLAPLPLSQPQLSQQW